MTIASETNKSGPYFYNGSATSFAYQFKISNAAHIRVVEAVVATGVETDLVLNTDYTVTGVGADAGGNVVISPSRAAGKSVTLVRKNPFTQEVVLENQGAYFAKVVEGALDDAVARDQQLQEQISRAVVVPVSADATDLETLIGGVVSLLDNVDAVVIVADNIGAVLAVPALATQTAADRVQTGLDRVATAADRVQTGLDRVATGQDKIATAADRVQTGLDRAATTANVTASLAELDSRAFAVASYHPPTAPNKISVSGYASPGDGGGALYLKVGSQPSHTGKFSIVLADAVTTVWYEIAATQAIKAGMFGATRGADDTAAVLAAINFAADNNLRFEFDYWYTVSTVQIVGKSGLLWSGRGGLAGKATGSAAAVLDLKNVSGLRVEGDVSINGNSNSGYDCGVRLWSNGKAAAALNRLGFSAIVNVKRAYSIESDRVTPTLTITAMTRSTTTVTCTVSSTALLETGQAIKITGAVQTQYNSGGNGVGYWFITVISATQFTFQIATTPTTPATGTIVMEGSPDLPVSENIIIGGYTYNVAQDVYAYGTQTVIGIEAGRQSVVIQGSWGITPFNLLVVGATASFTGGEAVHTVDTAGYGFHSQPAKSDAFAGFNNQYGKITLCNVLTEITSPLFTTSNPLGLSTPTQGGFFATLCRGVHTQDLSPFIATDGSFSGTISVQQNNWFTSGITRTQNNIFCNNANVQVYTDQESWGAGFIQGHGGVVSGILHFGQTLITDASDNGANTGIIAGRADIIYATENNAADLARWVGLYNNATGAWVCPNGGLDDVEFTVSQRANVGFTLELWLNGTMYKATTCSPQGSFAYGELTHKFKTLSSGDTVIPKILGTVSGVKDGGILSGIKVTASKR